MTTPRTTRIVIAGAGFGGTYTYRYLHRLLHGRSDVRISIVNRSNYFLFTPLLHEVATGGISRENIVEPIRAVLGCCLDDFYHASITGISFRKKKILTSNGDIPYDRLVVALGCETNFFSVPGAEKHCFGLKDMPDAVRLKNHLIRQLELANTTVSLADRRRLLTFVVIGGGATGVELACELSDFLHGTLGAYYSDELASLISIKLLHKGGELIPQFDPSLRKKSLAFLNKKRIDVRLQTEVARISKEGVVLVDGEVIATATPIWVAGVKPPTLDLDDRSAVQDDGKFLVTKALQSIVYRDVFALGDIAICKGTACFPQLAQVATRQAPIMAKNLLASIDGRTFVDYHYVNAGSLISLGGWVAAGKIGNRIVFGRFAWWLWRTVYLLKLHSFENQVKVALDWTFGLFTSRDSSELD